MAQLLDIGLSLAFSFVGNLLKPRTVDKSPDSLPNPQLGTKLYKGWGTFMCPGILMYALPPGLNKPVQIDKYNWSAPEESASYANFLITNPLTPSLLSVRVNGKIAASKSNYMPISKEFKGFQVTDVATSLTRVNDFNFRFLSGTQIVSDPIFVRGGNGNLVYNKQCLLIVDSSLRAIYGGRGSSVSVVMTSSVTSLLSPASTVFGSGNVPITIKYRLQEGIVGRLGVPRYVDKEIVIPSGYQFQQDCALFDGTSSILFNGAQKGSFVFGSGSETLLGTGLSSPTVTVVNGGVGITAATAPGSGSRIIYSGTPLVVSTNFVRVATVAGTTREIALTGTFTSPFYSQSGLIKNSIGTTVGSCAVNETVCGWNNTMFTKSVAVANNQTQPVGSNISRTDLVSIIAGLMAESGVNFAFDGGFNEDVLGFCTNREETTTDISNLLALYRKIVYQRRDGTLVFAPYPTTEPSLKVTREHHMSAPEINIAPSDQLTDVLNFSYRDIEREFDSTTIRIGGDSEKTTDFNVEIVAGATEASKLGQNLRNFQLSQTVTGTLQLHPICNTIEPGDTLVLEKLTSTGVDIPVIVLRVETGIDGSIRVEFINWTAFTPLATNLISDSTGGSATISREPIRGVTDTEPRSSRVGVTYYTEAVESILFAGQTLTPNVSNLSGTVTAISPSTATVFTPGQIPLVNTEYYLLDEVTGEGTWAKVLTVVNVSTDKFNLTMDSGLYASGRFNSLVNDMSISFVAETSTANDNYLQNSFVQSGGTYTWPFNTRKRAREPLLAYILASDNIVTFNRQDSLLIDNNDLGDISVLPSVTFKIRNLTTNLFILKSTTSAAANVDLTFSSGDIITVTQVNSDGSSFTGAVTNSYTAP